MEEIKITKRALFLNNDQAVLPRKLTAENGAKALLSGKFFEKSYRLCLNCQWDYDGDICEFCSGTGFVVEKIPVSWTTIEVIYDKIVEALEVKP